MKEQFGEYRRIARGFFGCSSFWRGPGHYLYVKGRGLLMPFTEDYHRFEMLKIHSVVATRTDTGTVWSMLCAIAATIFALAAIASFTGIDGSPSDSILYALTAVSAVAALLSLAVIAVNIVLGPTCVCCVRTAVRTERIRPLSRWRTARRQLEVMRAEIELAQAAALRHAAEAGQTSAKDPRAAGPQDTLEGGPRGSAPAIPSAP